MNLLLFGFKASGKTHFGKKLAALMHRPFIDTDDLIIELYGHKKPIRKIYEDLKEIGFRNLEKKTIPLLQNIENSIIGLGGGMVLDPENLEQLQKVGTLVYLKTSPEVLKKRIFMEELPAFFDKSDPERAFHDMIQEREPIYRSIPALTIDTDLLDEAGVIAALRAILVL